MILCDVDKDGKADVVLRRKGGKWQLDESAGHPFVIDPSAFHDEKQQKRFRDYLVNLRETP